MSNNPYAAPTPPDADHDDDEWRAKAACLGWDPDLWFPMPGEAWKVAIVRPICASCPVKATCLAEGRRMRYGIWGGQTESQRRIAKRASPIRRASCGREAGYLAHMRAGEHSCRPCLDATRDARRARRSDQ